MPRIGVTVPETAIAHRMSGKIVGGWGRRQDQCRRVAPYSASSQPGLGERLVDVFRFGIERQVRVYPSASRRRPHAGEADGRGGPIQGTTQARHLGNGPNLLRQRGRKFRNGQDWISREPDVQGTALVQI